MPARLMRLLAARLAALLAAGLVASAPAGAETLTRFYAPAGTGPTLTIRSSTDLAVMRPLIEDFQALRPDVSVIYGEHLTNELNDLAAAACREARPFADLVISSSADHIVKLVNDGCGRPHVSADTRLAPAYANWRDTAYGFTFEPAVIVYDRRAVPVEDVPHSRLELVTLLRDKPELYRGAVGTYDIVTSGIGYLFAAMDARQSSTYGRLIEAFGRSQTQLSCCTGAILDAIEQGRLKIGYNLLGSYAYRRLKAGAPIGVVLPRDYVLVLTRAVMVPKAAENSDLGAIFLDYLLSGRGQRVVAEQSFHFAAGRPLPDGVEAPTADNAASVFRPIAIGPGLIAIQDQAKRRRVLGEWNASMSRDR